MSLLYFAAWVNLSNTHDDSNNYYVPGMAKTLLLSIANFQKRIQNVVE